MNHMGRNLITWLGVFFGMYVLVNIFMGDSVRNDVPSVATSEFLRNVENGRVDEVSIRGNTIFGKTSDGKKFSTYYASHMDNTLLKRLYDSGIKVDSLPPEEPSPSILSVFFSILPILLLVGLSYLVMRHFNGGNNRAMGFGKSKAKLLGEKGAKVTFADVAGIDEAKQELNEIVDFLKDPKKFQRLGGKIPRGVLLVGPPGTGKTLLAKSIAGEAEVPFFSISGSDFVEMFVGVGASRVRDMFEQAKKNAPCIIFIDEIDAVGRRRGVGMGGGNDEREQTLNQLLVEMDGFEENEGVILVAATNRPDVLDPALLRPGRFDRQVVVPNPDINGREEILKVHTKKIPLSPNVDLRVIARGTPGFSGADLANLVNEAALLAARNGKLVVNMKDLESSKDKVMMGAERRTMAMSEDEKKLTAYHEAGHAIIAYYMPASDPIHKATIIPRGRALGMVVRLPEGDRISMSREKLLADICVAMGGRIAEEKIFGHEKVTTGASSDIEMATRLARSMITEWGMSDKLGFRNFEAENDNYMGYGPSPKPFSEKTSQSIDLEIREILDKCFDRANSLLDEKISDLDTLAKALITHETLTGEEIKSLIEDGKQPEAVEEEKSVDHSSIPNTEKKSEKKTNDENEEK